MATLELNVEPAGLESGVARAESALNRLKQQVISGERQLVDLVNGMTGVGRASAGAASAFDNFTGAIKREETAFEQLKASIDPVFAAKQRFEQQEQEIARAVRFGITTQEEGNRVLALAKTRYDTVTNATKLLTVAQSRARSETRNLVPAFTNASFQIQDFAVQVAAGTSASVAFAQQAPQFLGALGFAGRLGLLGSAAGTAVAVGAALLGVGRDAQEAEDAVDALTSAINDYATAANLSIAPTEELIDRYGSLATGLREELDLSQSLRFEDALAELQSFNQETSGAADGIESLVNKIQGLQDAGIRDNVQLTRAVSNLGLEYGLTVESAEDLLRAREQLAQAGDLEQAFSGARSLREALSGAFESVEDMPPAMRAFTSGVVESVLKAAELSAESSRVENAINGSSGAAELLALRLDDAARQMERLQSTTSSLSLDNIGIEAEIAALETGLDRFEAQARGAIAQKTADLAPALGSGDGLIRAGAVAELERYTQEINRNTEAVRRRSELLSTTSSTTRTGGGRSVINTEAREVQRLTGAYESLIASLDPAARSQIQFNRGMETLDAALDSGIISLEQYASAAGLLEQRLDGAGQASTIWSSSQQTISSALVGAVSDVDSLSGAFANLATQIAEAYIQAALFGSGPLFAGGGGGTGLLTGLLGGILPSANGNVFNAGNVVPSASGNVFNSGNVVPFETGGIVSQPTFFPLRDGRTGLMGEAGPEAIMPLRRGSDGKLGVEASGQQQQQAPSFALFVDESMFETWAKSRGAQTVLVRLMEQAGFRRG